jgi:molecular chaperone GrpE
MDMSEQAKPEPNDGAPAADAEPISVPAAEWEQTRSQLVEWKERCARQQAEFENVRRRLRKEADEAGTRAVARFVRPLLDQLDNLDRAVGAASPEAYAEFAQGVTMIRESLRASLAASGIEQVAGEGAFDPAVHEAIAEEERSDLPRGHIARVHRSGWKLKDQLVRSAQVVVARPPAPAATAPPPEPPAA